MGAESLRIDKWLWAVRIYKTRSLAAQACRAGQVEIGGQKVKPSREVRRGEIVAAKAGLITRTVKVLGLVDRRVGPKAVPDNLEELTPPSEFAKLTDPNLRPAAHHPRGLGRPTKKDRRTLGKLFPDVL